jgi:hypothetical protein
MKYLVLYWLDHNEKGWWEVYWWGTSMRRAVKQFNRCKLDHNNAGLIEVGKVHKRWYFPLTERTMK